MAFNINGLSKLSNPSNVKEQGIDILIGLGHSGYHKDQQIAKEVPHLDLVVGAHSHTFLNDRYY